METGLLTDVGCDGVLLSGGPGLLDPCEKESVDAVASLSLQQREDITNSAQVSRKCSVINITSISRVVLTDDIYIIAMHVIGIALAVRCSHLLNCLLANV